MAIQFKEFVRPAFSGNPDELKRKVIKYCNSELKCFRIISISEAKGISDDFYRITVWYDDEGEKYEHMMSSAIETYPEAREPAEAAPPTQAPPAES